MTSILLNNLYNIRIFNLYLFTIKKKDKNEYLIKEKINRILINNFTINNLIKAIIKKQINIFIYQLSYYNGIKALNKLKKIKILYYQHQSFFFWIYSNYTFFKYLYKAYKESKYIINLIHLENDYIFKKWGIKSILMNNFITYEYNSSFILNLYSQTILMIGRADDKFKRFELGIQAMEYIIEEIPETKMKIIANLTNIFNIKKIINILSLENNINFYTYTTIPEKYFINVSLNILPSISESFSLVLSETKICGIPSILIGLDYISIANGGIIIIYDDTPESIAKESLTILRDYEYRTQLGKEARRSMIRFKNKILIKKWINLILSIYYGIDYYEKIRKIDKTINEKKALNILQNQIMFFKKRKTILKNITINNLENLTFMENIN